jgi:hypothetical protein
MSNLGRRLRKLEFQITDHTGLVPRSPQWLEYWRERIDKILDREIDDLIPLAAVDAIMEEVEQQGDRNQCR